MHFKGLLSLLLLVATLHQAAADDDTDTTTTTTTTKKPSLVSNLAIKKADLVAEILEATNNLQDILPDNSLTISVESVGYFLLMAGIVAFVVHFLIGFGKGAPAAELYSYPSAPTTYSTGSAPGSGYAAHAAGYTQEEAYTVHRNLEQAAAKYQ